MIRIIIAGIRRVLMSAWLDQRVLAVAAGAVVFTADKGPTLTGYTLQGWYSAAEGGEKVLNADATSFEVGYNVEPAVTDKGNVTLTLYAHWTPNTYTVVYDKNVDDNSVSGTTASSSHTYDVEKNAYL